MKQLSLRKAKRTSTETFINLIFGEDKFIHFRKIICCMHVCICGYIHIYNVFVKINI